MNNFLPQDEEGRDKLAEKIENVVNLLNEIDGLKEDIALIAEEVEDKLNIKKTIFTKLAKAKYKEDAASKRMEAETVEETLNILFE